tara:strand:+ start:206 stop:403 length:198 start_codon:yes stop_codon:yes gene_type:complete
MKPRKKLPIALIIVKLVPMIREIIIQLRAAKADDGKVTPDEISDALLAGVAVALDEIAPDLATRL